jgi:hypothetical protein
LELLLVPALPPPLVLLGQGGGIKVLMIMDGILLGVSLAIRAISTMEASTMEIACIARVVQLEKLRCQQILVRVTAERLVLQEQVLQWIHPINFVKPVSLVYSIMEVPWPVRRAHAHMLRATMRVVVSFQIEYALTDFILLKAQKSAPLVLLIRSAMLEDVLTAVPLVQKVVMLEVLEL